MARARNIKPAFFDNDKLAENDPLGRLLFIGLWTIADHNGNLEWRAKRIKVKLLPYDDCDIQKLAINLDKSGFVRFYSDGNQIYLNIPNFLTHQNPHKNEREKGTEIPCYSEPMRQAVDLKGLTINRDKSGLDQESSTSDPADSLIPYPESLNLIPDCGSPNSEDPPPAGDEGADEPPKRTPKAKLTKSDLMKDFGISEESAVQFLQVRKDKRQTLTPKAMDDLVREFGKAGLSVADGIDLCTRRSWAGFKASWDWQGTGQPSGQPAKETPRERAIRMAKEEGIHYDPK